MTRPPIAGVVEVGSELYAVEAGFDGVPLTTYIVGDPRRGLALVDTGVAGTPQDRILPALRALGVTLNRLDLVVNTHAHHDHVGGNAAIRAAAPRVSIAVHSADAEWAQSPTRYYAELYGQPREGLAPASAAFRERILRLSGAGARVDRPLRDGDCVPAAGGALVVRWMPAHSPGHIVALDSGRDAVFIGDALQGHGFAIAGRRRLFPSYLSVPAYRSSVQAIADGTARHVCSAHFGVLDRRGTRALATESLAFADALDTLLLTEHVRRGGLTVADGVRAALAAWPQFQPGVQAHLTVRAHLRELARQRRTAPARSGHFAGPPAASPTHDAEVSP